MVRRQVAGVALAVAVVAWGGAALGSEEEIHPFKRVTAVADAGASFGEVEVRAEASSAAKPALKSLALTIKGTKLEVPAAALAGLPPLSLASLEVRSERGYDKEPWLYVVFTVEPHLLPAGAKRQVVHFAVNGGKVRYRSVTLTDASGQSKWDKKDL